MIKDKFKKFIRTNYLSLIGAATGAIGGYLYFYFIGCESGSCAITSSANMSIIWGALIGYSFLGLFEKK